MKREVQMAHARLNEATAEVIRDRYRTSFASAFVPQFRYDQMPGTEERTAYAAEFVAFRLGQIDEKLGCLIAVLERGIGQTSSPKQ
jgi:hypothetical protein